MHKETCKRILQKLQELSSLDRCFAIFGAQHHRYQLTLATLAELLSVESSLGVEIPAELRSLYIGVGSGAGPGYCLLSPLKAVAYQVTRPFPGVEAIKKQLLEADPEAVDEDGYFEASEDQLTGLLGIVALGCGHMDAVVTAGPLLGQVVCVGNDGFVIEHGIGFLEYYEKWLDEQLGQLKLVYSMMKSGSSLDKIEDALEDKYNSLKAHEYLASIAGAKLETNGLSWNDERRICEELYDSWQNKFK